jgi:hypothetical protein
MFGQMIRKFNGSPEIEKALTKMNTEIRQQVKIEQIDAIYNEARVRFDSTLRKMND